MAIKSRSEGYQGKFAERKTDFQVVPQSEDRYHENLIRVGIFYARV
jgi:hypothetical protein